MKRGRTRHLSRRAHAVLAALAALATSAAWLATPSSARAETALEAKLAQLSEHGRWEQVLIATEGVDPLSDDAAAMRDRAERESRNVVLYLRVRNAVKRRDYGTAIVVGAKVDADSVYRVRTDWYVKKARARYGRREARAMLRRPGRAEVELALVRKIDPDNRHVVAAAERIERRRERDAQEPDEVEQGEIEYTILEDELEEPAQPTVEEAREPAEVDTASVAVISDTRTRDRDVAADREELSIDEVAEEIDIRSERHEIERVAHLDGQSLEHYIVADSAMEDDDLPRAIEYFEKVVDQAPGYPNVYLRLGIARYGLDDIHGAAEAFSRYLELEPNDPRAPQLHAFISEHHTPGPSEMLPRDRARAFLTEAHRALAAGNTEGAVAWLKRSTETDPTFAPPKLQLGLIQERAGRTPEAVEAYEAYLELEPDGTHAAAVRQTLVRLLSVTRSDGF